MYSTAVSVLRKTYLQYIPRNMHTVTALLCFVVVIYWLIFPYPSGLLHWHCGNLTITPVPAKQPWWIWINTSCEFIMNDYITTTKQSTTKQCAYFLRYTVYLWLQIYFQFDNGKGTWVLVWCVIQVALLNIRDSRWKCHPYICVYMCVCQCAYLCINIHINSCTVITFHII